MTQHAVLPTALSLDHAGGDVWAWHTRVSGACPGCPPEASIALRGNGTLIPALRDGDLFSANVPLAPGRNALVAEAVLAGTPLASSAPVVYTVPIAPRPTARLAVRIDGSQLVFDGRDSSPSDADGAEIRSWHLTPGAGHPGLLNLSGIDSGIWTSPPPKADGEYSAMLTVEDQRGRRDSATTRFVVEHGLARAPDPRREHAAWLDRAVVYGVAPRNFDPPGFAGVTARLDDLVDLGVTALWLSPSTRTNPGSYGYDVTDYFDVRPEYGTKAQLRALIAAAHQRGLRVLMDFVPNHTSDQHPYFRDAADHGPASRYWNFYDRDAAGSPTHYFNWIHLPNLNVANPEVQRFMLEALRYWVREFDIDGFRLDAIWGIRERHPAWLDTLVAEMRRIKPEMLLIAEASARDPFYADHGFDAAYDWTGDLGHWAWERVFAGAVPIGQAVTAALLATGPGDDQDPLVLRFLNNNDTGYRFITTHGVDCYRVALAMLLTLPGLPCLFTGDETGAEFQPYETSGPIDWRDRHGMRAFVQTLICLRQRTPALHGRAWQPLAATPSDPLFAYRRTARGASPVIVALNFSPDGLDAVIELPEEESGPLRNSKLIDLRSGESMPAPTDGRVTIPLPGWGFRVLSDDQG